MKLIINKVIVIYLIGSSIIYCLSSDLYTNFRYSDMGTEYRYPRYLLNKKINNMLKCILISQ